MTFLTILDAVGFFVMVMFTIWNWFQALFGSTTIEFMKQRGIGIKRNEARLRFANVSDNLYRIFGTHKIFRIFSPSFRNVPFTGLEWSFRFKDEGYDCDGFKIEDATRMQKGASLNPGVRGSGVSDDSEGDSDGEGEIEMIEFTDMSQESSTTNAENNDERLLLSQQV